MISTIDQPARQSVMQYSLRAIFIATLAVAAMCGAIAPFLRNSPAFREAFLRTLAMASIGAALPVAWNCWNRYRLEKRCGARLLIISKFSGRKRSWWLGLHFFGALSMLAFDIYVNAEILAVRSQLPPGQQRSLHFSILPFMAGSYLASAFLNVWWKGANHSTELCEYGVILGNAQLVGWDQFRGYRKAFDGTLQLLRRFDFMTLPVPAELWEQTTSILDTYIPPAAVAPK